MRLLPLGPANIVSVEEAVKYSLFTQYVSDSYQLPVRVISRSLYELEVKEMQEVFDIVYFPGVLYHLSDPVMALRIPLQPIENWRHNHYRNYGSHSFCRTRLRQDYGQGKQLFHMRSEGAW